MEKVIETLIMALAVWRISSIIVREDFIFDVMAKLRAKLGVLQIAIQEMITIAYDKDEPVFSEVFYMQDAPSYLQPTWIAKGIKCLWCVSFWTGLLFGLGYMFVYGMSLYSICLPFVLSALAIGYDEVV